MNAKTIQSIRTNPPQVMDAAELAIYLGASKDTVYTQAQLGAIPSKKVGGCLRFYLGSIQEWLRAGRK